MSAWTERVSLEAARAVLERALARGYFTDESPAAVFHDLGRMRARITELRERFPATTLHAVAIKANPLVEVLRRIVAEGAGLEAASIEEVHLALAAGCPPSRVIYDSPAKTRAELGFALERGVRINADNFEELARIAALLERDGRDGRDGHTASVIGLRVNPVVGAGAIASTSVASRSSKFGVPIDAAGDAVFQAFARYPWLTGLHVHVGSQGCGLTLLTAAAAKVAELRHALNQRLGRAQVTSIDIGGGLPVAYRAEDAPPSLAEYVAALEAAAPSLFERPIQLSTEFGRAIHATAGWAASRVEYVKQDGDEPLAVLHLGADFLLRRIYNPTDWHHDLAVFDAEGRPKGGPEERVSIAGPLCFAGDVISRGAMLPRILPGDLVVLRDVGAYTLSMWSRHCSRALPPVLGHEDGRLDVLRARETQAEVVSFWSRGGASRER